MAALGRFFRQEGLYTFVRWNTFFTNPPLCITEEELATGSRSSTGGWEIDDGIRRSAFGFGGDQASR